MSNSELLHRLISEYKECYLQKQKSYEATLTGETRRIKDELLDEKFKPSLQLKNILNKQIKRTIYPLEVAIVGQFSSGKSTFLNALISKDILPTGITPVTSKVIYINYGEEHKLKVTYNSGATVYHPIEHISMFSDQRLKNRDNIKYLTIYAPVKILKDISFVDTPGLNSQSQADTSSTKRVLKDVGGIIWLTLIDNAGKRSEQEILDEYLPSFKRKSLCVLNQKDKFNQEQIEATTSYIEEKFSNYFSSVVPISAKLALDARTLEPSILIDSAVNELVKDFKKGLEKNSECTTLKFFSQEFENFKKRVDELKRLDRSEIDAKLEESNINSVIDFIENSIRPHANESKAFRIINDLKNICDILINSYTTMTAVYDSLSSTLENSKDKSSEQLAELEKIYSPELKEIHKSIDTLFLSIAQEIYENVVPKEKSDYKSVKGSFFNQEKIESYRYSSFFIDQNAIMDKLFYSDQMVEKMNKKMRKKLKFFEENTNLALDEIFVELEKDVVSWQKKYLLLSKNREISSDLEFSSVKRFASKVYENVLNTFHASILKYRDALNNENAYLRGALSYNFKQAVEVTLCQLSELILESEETYKRDPGKFSVYKPSEEEILQKLKLNFDFGKLDDSMSSRNSYLSKIVRKAKEDFLTITEDKINFIEAEKQPYIDRMEDIQNIKSTIKYDVPVADMLN